MKEKRFTVVVKTACPEHLNEQLIQQLLKKGLVFNCGYVEVQAFEHNKTHTCDGCGKERRDVKACGRDGNGDPDAPDLCFICRKQYARGRQYNFVLKRYVPFDVTDE
jgi:hypothetical protein